MSRRYLLEVRTPLPALGPGVPASGMKMTPFRRVDGAGNFTSRYLFLTSLIGIRYGHRIQQGSGVGMMRIAEQLVPRAHFDDPAEIHNGDPVAEILRRCQVMSDKEIGEVELALELFHQLRSKNPHRSRLVFTVEPVDNH